MGDGRSGRHGAGPSADFSIRVLSCRLSPAELFLRLPAFDARVLDGELTSVSHIDARLRHASPLVVIGMHRSGTRLVVDILDRLGVFMGADRQADSESVAFMRINEGILHQCGAFWSEPMSAHFMLADADAAQRIAANIDEAIAAGLEGYAGRSGWHLGTSTTDLPPFGW